TVGELHAQADNLYRRMKSDNHRMNQIVGALQEDVRQIRLRPLSVILDSFPRMVRDLARSLGKEVHLVIEGEETEVDRSVVEILKPPLVHLVRNAVDHGIEMPEARRAAGKDPVGQVEIRAAQRGDVIVIEIRDDGAGIDARRVLDKALAAGILSQEQAASMSESEILWLIFRAGFSTRHTVSDISGRGVGLDVVWDALEKIQGSISVSTEPGRGTCFTLTVPLTIATVLCLLVDVQGHTFAAPVLAVDRILHLGPGDVRWVEGAPVVKHHGEPLPLASLAQVLGLPRDAETRFEGPAVLMSSGERHAVLLVDGLLGVQELVVKNLPPPLYRLRNIAGASILGDGRATPILNINDLLLEVAQGQRFVAAVHPAGKSEPATPPTILVADDSVTTRTLERTILETAGYQVHTAVDGADAWEQLQATPVDLVVSDVDMPRMNGFQLTEAIRSHERLQDLPVILVTSLDSPEDRQRGVDAGADAYIVKGAFDQEHLLATIEKFI
ncbi:MAG: hybrid sensor histidine kinase/response regulator, partial [Caldilineae bacterium]